MFKFGLVEPPRHSAKAAVGAQFRHLQAHGEQLHCPASQDQEPPPHSHGTAAFGLAFLPFFCLRFDFIVIDS